MLDGRRARDGARQSEANSGTARRWARVRFVIQKCLSSRALRNWPANKFCDSRLMRSTAALTLLLAPSALAATADLTTKSFDKKVFKTGRYAFVKFIAPW